MKVSNIPLNRIVVSTIMDPPVFVDEFDNVLVVIKMLLKTRKGYVLVTRNNKDTIGIISDRDIQRLILKEAGMFSPELIAKDFMVKPVIFITKNQTLHEAEDLMRENEINRLPVVENKNSKLVLGVINYETVHSNIMTSFARSWLGRS